MSLELHCLTNKHFIQNLCLAILLSLQSICTANKIIPFTNPDTCTLPFRRVAAQLERVAYVQIIQVKSAAKTELQEARSRPELCENCCPTDLLFSRNTLLGHLNLLAESFWLSVKQK